MTAHRRRARRGVALLTVLWVIAGLSVLVVGLVQTQRAELQQAGAARTRLHGESAGRSAINLTLQRMKGGGLAIDRLTRLSMRWADKDIAVEITPMTGLIDLNAAPEPLLRALLTVAGGLDDERARAVAGAMLAVRESSATAPERRTRLESVDELTSVPGVDYDLSDRLRPLITTDSGGSGRVNALAAPEPVLRVLARGDAALARRVADQRDAGSPGVDTTQLETALLDASLGTRFRIQAAVPAPDGSTVYLVRDVDTAPAAARPGVAVPPWQVLRDRGWRVGVELKRGQGAN